MKVRMKKMKVEVLGGEKIGHFTEEEETLQIVEFDDRPGVEVLMVAKNFKEGIESLRKAISIVEGWEETGLWGVEMHKKIEEGVPITKV